MNFKLLWLLFLGKAALSVSQWPQRTQQPPVFLHVASIDWAWVISQQGNYINRLAQVLCKLRTCFARCSFSVDHLSNIYTYIVYKLLALRSIYILIRSFQPPPPLLLSQAAYFLPSGSFRGNSLGCLVLPSHWTKAQCLAEARNQVLIHQMCFLSRLFHGDSEMSCFPCLLLFSGRSNLLI